MKGFQTAYGGARSLDQSTLNQTLVAPKYARHLGYAGHFRYAGHLDPSSRSSTNSNLDCSSRHEQRIPILPYPVYPVYPACPACPAYLDYLADLADLSDLSDLSLSQVSAFASALSAILPTVCDWGKSV
ncbi:hypothetical protein NDA11_003433 [Ustilago hordei]|uniref:Uncharacterized protein n=1 Tax=Ustilago hordei TaxID=120017 RepID=I2FNI0_USTHO|nr:uncharacterized protein UHO2_07011 [Ustilago hordei]KAJ1572356.1 hypothetical protein NDA11_003433 [Ustilago hordei]CCF48473.1 uncharacterized protein UHOR_09004 [Ustilago hordei]SYW81103.1 uncharacterized protein UHO2_07011 [Ustilago hordei]